MDRPTSSAPVHRLPAVVATLGLLLGLVATASPAEALRNLSATCDEPPAADYLDREKIPEVHLLAVDCLTERGVVEGFANDQGTLYFPSEEVPRGQMAVFLVRMLEDAGVDLPAADDQGFVDVEDGSIFAADIRSLAAAGIVRGTGDDRYEAGDFVTRGQMATFLVRAVAYAGGVEAEDLQGGDTPFIDVPEDGVHRPSIDGARQLLITNGVSEDRYAPTALVTRAEMATFVVRALDAALTRTTVSDLDTGALARTTFTFLSESGRCMQVTAGEAWVTRCDAASGETPLDLYLVEVDESFTVVAGVVTDAVATVEIETTDDQVLEVELVATRSEGLRAFSATRLADGIAAVVARDAEGAELDREVP